MTPLLRLATLASTLFACALDAAAQGTIPGGAPGAGPSVGTVPGRPTPSVGRPSLGPRTHAPPDPPNVLVIVADDLGVDMVPAYGVGSDYPHLPTIDGLVADGMMFHNVWASPTCSPTRATIQTGRYGFRTGIGSIVDLATSFGQTVDGLPLEEITLPEMLDAGTKQRYAHAAIGKWHLGSVGLGGPLAPNVAGYDHFAGILSNFGATATYFEWPRVVDGAVVTSTTYATTQNVDDALAFIRSAPEPWFCHLAFSAPHAPFHEPPAELHGVDLSVGGARAKYKAMVQAMDTEMGRLFDSISPPTLGRTNVMFLGDNGTPGPVVPPNVDGTKAKGTLFEGGVRVPLIVTGPAVAQPGSTSSQLVHTVDLFATIADLAGVDLAATYPDVTFDAISFAPLLADPDAPSERTVLLTEQFNPNGAVPPSWPLPCDVPTGTFCQPDLGFGGPGAVTLSICGEALYGGAQADLDVLGAQPNATGLLFVGPESNPTPFQGGTLVPFPNFTLTGFTTDALGEFRTTVIGGLGLGSLYHQVYVEDLSLPKGWAVSNAVRADYLPTDRRAIRDGRFKYVVNTVNCEERFYDLTTDPTESNDLLGGTLTPAQQTVFDDLSLTLQQMVDVLR